MVQERERPVGGERREPKREPGELDCHWVGVNAKQAPLGDRPPDQRAIVGPEVVRTAVPAFDQR